MVGIVNEIDLLTFKAFVKEYTTLFFCRWLYTHIFRPCSGSCAFGILAGVEPTAAVDAFRARGMPHLACLAISDVFRTFIGLVALRLALFSILF